MRPPRWRVTLLQQEKLEASVAEDGKADERCGFHGVGHVYIWRPSSTFNQRFEPTVALLQKGEMSVTTEATDGGVPAKSGPPTSALSPEPPRNPMGGNHIHRRGFSMGEEGRCNASFALTCGRTRECRLGFDHTRTHRLPTHHQVSDHLYWYVVKDSIKSTYACPTQGWMVGFALGRAFKRICHPNTY